jgi:hypothetical protein
MLPIVAGAALALASATADAQTKPSVDCASTQKVGEGEGGGTVAQKVGEGEGGGAVPQKVGAASPCKG